MLFGLEHVRIEPGNTAFTPLDFYDYPISHSLLSVVGWSGGFAIVYYMFQRYRRGAWVIGAAVLSHWVLDFITHRPDLPLVPGSASSLGLGLWNSVSATLVLEGGLVVAGLALYLRSTKASDRTGRYSFWFLIAFLVIIYVANRFAPLPRNEDAIAITALLLWLLVPWGYWIDRHRRLTGKPVPQD